MSPHVAFVAVLFMVGGALTTVVGVSMLALGVGAAALLSSTGPQGGGPLAVGLMAAAFTAVAVIAVIWGLVHVAIGVPLRRRRHWSRLGALMLGSVDLALLPYGTALGAYTLWALLSEEGRKLFET